MEREPVMTFEVRRVREVLEEPARLAAIRTLRLHERDEHRRFAQLTRTASRTLGAPVCLVSAVSADRQTFVHAHGIELEGTPLSHSFCQYVVASDAPLAVADARRHPVLRDNGSTTELGVVSYLGVPLRTSDGHVVGSLCVVDSEPREWDDAGRELLEVLAGSVVAIAELAASARRLESATDLLEARSRSTEELLEIVQVRRRDDLRRLASDVHDTALQDLIAAKMLLAGDDGQPSRVSAGECVSSALVALRRIVEGLAPIDLPHADPSAYVAERVRDVSDCFGVDALCDIDLAAVEAEPELKLLAHRATMELVRNACRHAGGSAVTVRVGTRDEAIHVEVVDDGPGWDPVRVSHGAGLPLLADELHGLGGTLYGTHVDAGFRVVATIPCRAVAELAA